MGGFGLGIKFLFECEWIMVNFIVRSFILGVFLDVKIYVFLWIFK